MNWKVYLQKLIELSERTTWLFIICTYLEMCSNQLLYVSKVIILLICSTQGESLYEVLGISKQATPEEIKKAYRKVTKI